MNKKHTLTSALILLSVISHGVAHADESADRTALRAIRESYEQAVTQNRIDTISGHFAPDSTVVTVTDHEVSSFKEFSDYYAKIKTMIGPRGSYSLKATVDKTELFGDISVSRGVTDDSVIVDGNKELKFRSHWTAVCRRVNGDWKLLRLHASMDPLDNPFVRAKVCGAATIYGLGGFAAGALVAGLAFFINKRRKSHAAKI